MKNEIITCKATKELMKVENHVGVEINGNIVALTGNHNLKDIQEYIDTIAHSALFSLSVKMYKAINNYEEINIDSEIEQVVSRYIDNNLSHIEPVSKEMLIKAVITKIKEM